MKEKKKLNMDDVREFIKRNWKKGLVYAAAAYGVAKAGLEIYQAASGVERCDLYFKSNEEKNCLDLDISYQDRFGGMHGLIADTHVSVEEAISLRDYLNKVIGPISETEKTE